LQPYSARKKAKAIYFIAQVTKGKNVLYWLQRDMTYQHSLGVLSNCRSHVSECNQQVSGLLLLSRVLS